MMPRMASTSPSRSARTDPAVPVASGAAEAGAPLAPTAVEEQHAAERSRLLAIVEALFVTVLWSSSWVLIRRGFDLGMAPLPFAGVRYVLAATVLLAAVASRASTRAAVRALSVGDWIALALLGVVYYTATQGGVFVGLALLPAATFSLLLNLTPVVVSGHGVATGRERPSGGQVVGLAIAAAGVLLYFFPVAGASALALAVGVAVLVANAAGAVLGRGVAHRAIAPPLVVTALSMAIGAALLLGVGIATAGLPQLDARAWAIVLWLAVVNTALAFTLWNRALRHLTAVESSVINGTMLPQLALLGWWFLGEPLGPKAIVGLALVGVGTVVVQLRR